MLRAAFAQRSFAAKSFSLMSSLMPDQTYHHVPVLENPHQNQNVEAVLAKYEVIRAVTPLHWLKSAKNAVTKALHGRYM